MHIMRDTAPIPYRTVPYLRLLDQARRLSLLTCARVELEGILLVLRPAPRTLRADELVAVSPYTAGVVWIGGYVVVVVVVCVCCVCV